MIRRLCSVAFIWLCAWSANARAQQFLWSPLDTLTRTCDFCCYRSARGACHGAIDFRARTPTAVFAADAGTVVLVVNRYLNQPNREWGYGNRIVLRHENGYRTLYAHLTRESIRVRVGEEVEVGQQIALSDNSGYSTGPHLHFEVQDPQGQRVNPYGNPPDYAGGCGAGALWATCPPQRWDPRFADRDEDGYCADGSRCVGDLVPGDCDDGNADIHPDVPDLCDGVDNDCSGAADERFVDAGLFTECSLSIGGCRTSGTWVCAAGGEALFCTAPAAGIPRPESCDGQDNDCNGAVDDGAANAACQDALYCNGQEQCVGGVCVLGEPVLCNDGVACTFDLCWEPTDTCSTVADHSACNDADSCTSDACWPSGCHHEVTLDADDDGFVAATCPSGTDCRDDDPAIHLGALEVCNSRDDNCDGVADEEVADCWRAVSTVEAPMFRWGHTAVWTGSEMIIWGGDNPLYLSYGGRYSPLSNTWSEVGDTDAPWARTYHTAVWTGSEMIVWGGISYAGLAVNTGGRYSPTDDAWTATLIMAPPVGRYDHTAIWTGSEMIISSGRSEDWIDAAWAGYAPTDDEWRLLPFSGITTSGITTRYAHTAVWTGSEMIMWGGCHTDPSRCPVDFVLNTGGRYRPSTNTWVSMSTLEALSARRDHTVVWTGSEMIVWGGYTISGPTNTGGRYNSTTDAWNTTIIAGAPSPRWGHTAVWTGSEMIVWGGYTISGPTNTGGRYDPVTDVWLPLSSSGIGTAARHAHTVVWTGSEMIVWGGRDGIDYLATGGRYTPP